MTGKYRVTVSNAKMHYDFTIRRNITILKGNSATGKTTLVEMIQEYYDSGSGSGVELICDVPCRVLRGRDWNILLSVIHGSIVFIDEDNEFLTTDAFSAAAKESDNYYVIITREGLPNLPYSVDEIYGIRESGKYGALKKVYQEFYHIYNPAPPFRRLCLTEVITEDSNAGFEFMEGIAVGKEYRVISSFGKSNIFELLLRDRNKNIFILADGAAFGAEIDRVMKLIGNRDNIVLFLPESFEWLILASGLIDGSRIQRILEDPEKYIESGEFFSWERFFTNLLINETVGTPWQYSKRKLNEIYLHSREKEKILQAMGPAGDVFG